MDQLQYQGKLKFYLQLPFYMIIVFVIGNIILYMLDPKLGVATSICVVFYTVLTILLYRNNQKKIEDEIINFAVRYGTVQKRMLNEFELPYALLDSTHRFVWMNEAFCNLTGRDRNYQKSVTSIFKELTKETMERADEDVFSTVVHLGDKVFDARLHRLYFDDSENKNQFIAVNESMSSMTALTLFDITELQEVKGEVEDLQMVPAYVYVDNFEETVDSLEDVKRSLLLAVLDRAVNKYFQKYDGIVRKIEKDKYFVVFQHRFLRQMEESKFSLLEEVKSIKVGNENDITLSIGIGLNGESYVKNAEYARAAINIALGRGGAQAVVKNNQEVSYYGSHGKEIEKNTRVKARVKAQALREMISSHENVLVMGHSLADADAFGAAVGVCIAARNQDKKAQIVLNSITSSLRPLVEQFSEEHGYPADMIINSEAAISALTTRTLVMVVDTNRPNYTDCPKLLEMTDNIVVFDHHRQGTEQIEGPLLSYIEPYASSTCEMIAETLHYYSEDIQIKPMEADTIYAGILIDTNNFMTKTGVRTFEAAAYLRRCGADVARVRKLLREDMRTYKARAEIVRHAEVYRNVFAISVCESTDLESPTVVSAQASNELLNIVGIKASFVLTAFNNKIYVSSRSIDEIDVQLIMERLGGGGHLHIAGTQIENSTIPEVKQRIQDVIDKMIDEGEITI